MIISKTPLRISFFGGGTDLSNYYSRKSGSVLSVTINRYVYVTINRKFEDGYRLSYSIQESPMKRSEIRHPLIRNSLEFLEIDDFLEITSIAEVPSKGSGLGSSSSFTVGLLNALSFFSSKEITPSSLAINACKVEIDLAKEPIGKQDQFAAAYGGLNFFEFLCNGEVTRSEIKLDALDLTEFNSKFMLFFTGITRDASPLLSEQSKELEINRDKEVLYDQAKLQSSIGRQLLESKDFQNFGHLMHDAWMNKKKFHSNISNELIDSYYLKAMQAGALGGKLLGAGGGGFLLFYVENERQNVVRKALDNLQLVPFNFDFKGSRLIKGVEY